MHGRLRARPGAVVARRRPGRLQRQAAGARHGRASRRSWPAPSGASRRWPTRASIADDQRARGLHARQRVHPRRIGGPRVLRRRRVLAPTGSPAPAGSAARSRRGSSTASRSSTCGRWTSGGSAASLAVARVHARPVDRELRDLLRHPLPERGAPGRPAAADGADLRAARGRSARSSARSPAGSARTGSSRTPTTRVGGRDALEACRPRGWAGQHWSPGDRRRGAGDAAGRRRCSTRRRSPRSRSSGRARSRSSSRLCANDVDVPVGRIVYTSTAQPARRDRVAT